MTRTVAVWAAVAAADRFSVSERETLAAGLAQRGIPPGDEVALVTCHRVEVYGVAAGDGRDTTANANAGATLPDPSLLRGEAAIRHLFGLAVGLESAVLGEDQVLHQVRLALRDLRDRRGDPRLIRLLELAVGAGRRARALHPAADRNLGELAVRWLERQVGSLRGRDVVVAGAGRMGRLAARAMARRGANLVVASRSAARARSVAHSVAGDATDLPGGAARAASASGVVVALAGPWSEFDPRVPMAVVDLSFPPSVPGPARAALGAGLADVDRLFREAGSLQVDSNGGRDFRASAEAIVDESVAAYRAWTAGRPSVSTLRALRDRSESHRTAELERLLRRLPDLDPRERELVEAFSQQLVAGLLHKPLSALRDDEDGSAAHAAQRLFGL